MAEEFEDQDLSDASFWGVDLSRARFRDVNLTGAKISHAFVVDVEIDALVERLTINGVDVTQFVNDHDPWYPLRGMLRPEDADGMRAAWDALEESWAATFAQAEALTPEQRNESVGGEWSFVQSLRHLLFCMDKWFTVPILGDEVFDPIGMPNSGSVNFGWPGLNQASEPTYGQVVAARAEHSRRFREYLATLDASVFDRPTEILENGTVPLNGCLFTVFEEEFEHNRYIRRDLATIA